jgi:hypothetical protein
MGSEIEPDTQSLKLEIQQYKEKIIELEKWLVLLLNNFYEGNPKSLKSIEHVTILK